MNRMKPYDLPHKAIRNALSQLSLLAGKTSYTNEQEVSRLFELGQAVFGILSIHARDENAVTLHELELKVPGASQHDLHDHKKIEAMLAELEQQLEKLLQDARQGNASQDEGDLFYMRLNHFHATYLHHMHEEETETQPLLLQHFTDEELAGHRRKIMAGNPPETLLTWFRFVFPAQSQRDNLGLVQGFRANAPQAFFERAVQEIRKYMSKEEFEMLEAGRS